MSTSDSLAVGDLSDKGIIITGQIKNVGFETALELTKRGAHLILACKDQVIGERALRNLKEQSKNDRVELELLDLSNLASIDAFAKRMYSKLKCLHVLINNASSHHF